MQKIIRCGFRVLTLNLGGFKVNEVLELDVESPIGIFDSGIGGLTVVRALVERLPRENFIYIGDTAHIPYGNKTQAELFSYAEDILSFFISQGVKAVLVACGTHSSVTLPELASRYSFPMLGVLKAGARSACRTSRNLRAGVMATQATVNSQAYTREIRAINPEFKVFERACHRFVPLVESGQIDGEETREAVKEYLTPLLDERIDTLVLGCTHYPFLLPLIKEFAGEGINVVDPACETVEELSALLHQHQLVNEHSAVPVRQYFVTGNAQSFYDVGTRLIGDTIKEVKQIVLD